MADSKPLLFDSFCDAIFRKHRDIQVPEMVNLRRVAEHSRVMVLDDAAVDRFADIVREVPDLIIKHQEFARCPYPQLWVEFDVLRFWERVTGRRADATADRRIAYAFNNDTVAVAGGGNTRITERDFEGMLPIIYRLHDPWTIDEELRFCDMAGISRTQLDAFMWGESLLKLDDPQRRALRAHHSIRFSGQFNDRDVTRSVFNTVYNGSAGDLRNIVALLLMLNRPSVTRYVDIPRRRGFIERKLRPLAAHTVVKIDVDPKPFFRMIGTPEGESVARRRHEVRGAYCHDATAREGRLRGCEHDWQEDHDYEPDEETGQHDNWKCSHCGGKRWWRRHHMRGSESLGWVDKHYELTARKPGAK